MPISGEKTLRGYCDAASDGDDKILSPRAALLVCAIAALVGWLAVAALVYAGKYVFNELSNYFVVASR